MIRNKTYLPLIALISNLIWHVPIISWLSRIYFIKWSLSLFCPVFLAQVVLKLDFSLFYDIIVIETGGNDLGTIKAKFK